MKKTIFATNHVQSGFINKIDTYEDLNLIQQSVEVSPAKIKSSYVELPCANGAIDTTATNADAKFYANRTITWKFTSKPGVYSNLATAINTVCNAIKGTKLRIYLQEGATVNTTRFYYGRTQVSKSVQNGSVYEFTLTADVEPFVYEYSYNESYNSANHTYTFAHEGCAGLKVQADPEDDNDDNVFSVYDWETATTKTFNIGNSNVGVYRPVPGLRVYPSKTSTTFTIVSGNPYIAMWKGWL